MEDMYLLSSVWTLYQGRTGPIHQAKEGIEIGGQKKNPLNDGERWSHRVLRRQQEDHPLGTKHVDAVTFWDSVFCTVQPCKNSHCPITRCWVLWKEVMERHCITAVNKGWPSLLPRWLSSPSWWNVMYKEKKRFLNQYSAQALCTMRIERGKLSRNKKSPLVWMVASKVLSR